MATIEEKGHPATYNEDEARLAKLGYKQNMKRQFSGLQNFGFTLTNSSVLIGIIPLFGFGMVTGGPIVAIWGWLLVAFFVMFIGLGMAEICSTYPTAGGLYFWTAKLGGPKWGPMFSWYEAWFNILGQVAGCSGSVLAAATFTNSMIAIWNPSYELTGKKNFYIMAAYMITAGLVNSAGGRALKVASLVSVFVHIAGTIAIIIVILVGAPKLQSAKWVFTDFEDTTGYTAAGASPVFVFMLGLLQSQWSMLGYDASAHMSEETERSYVNGPRGILLSIFASVMIGLGLALAMTFGIQNYAATLSSAYGGAAQQIFVDCAGKKGGTVLIFIVVFAGFLCGVATVAANSRMLYAFARDGGLPFSPYWTVLNKRTMMPLRLVWLSVTVVIILALPSLGSAATLSAISGISIIGFTTSYAIPILLRITVGSSTFVQHEFNLGRFSKPIGWVAVIWTAFIFIIFNLPQSWPVSDVDTFNFTPAAVGFLLAFSTLTWFLSAKNWFKGPISEIALKELDGIVPVEPK
ncbi:choline transport protein [Entomortierella parvispora]|uniref:Choline transport protein n=1 Tax=Entomortierella parvispora TaxID=205924 RepID=A0A9P3M327_9FUNG|nr:choline transport protein [Entomortierella parvispora]